MTTRITTRRATLALATLAFALGIGAQAKAQPLDVSLCPAGTVLKWRPAGWKAPIAGDIPLLRKTIDTVAHPNAACNDGTPAVMYIRPANAAWAMNPIVDESSKWLIFFDGGGGCQDADSCLLERWCSGGTAPFDRAGKMSSTNMARAIRSPGGILKVPAPAGFTNEFAEYNQVLVHYCSSDNWQGSASLSGITTSTGVGFDIRFEGEAIVNAVMETLLAGPTGADPAVAAEYYHTQLPDLKDATEILIGGESAGAGGVRHHLDRLREEDLELLIPEVEVRAVLDAGFTPTLADPAIDWSDPYSPGDYADHLLRVVQPVTRSFRGADDTALDASCLDPAFSAAHTADGSHPQVCYDTTYTQLEHITTPVFVRMDIDDPLGKERFTVWNLYPTTDDYWVALFDQLTQFSSFALVAGVPTSTAGGLEPMPVVSGVYAPNCRQHVAIQTDSGFYRHHVSGIANPLSFHDLLVNWLTGVPAGPDTIQIQQDNLGAGAYSASVCP